MKSRFPMREVGLFLSAPGSELRERQFRRLRIVKTTEIELGIELELEKAAPGSALIDTCVSLEFLQGGIG